MDLDDRISINPDILAGKAIIKGTRISIEFIVELLANSWSFEEIIQNYPQLTKKDILAALNYSVKMLKSEKVYVLE